MPFVDPCPHFNRSYCITDVVSSNIANYGSNVFHVPCKYCNKMIEVYYVREVTLKYIKKSNKKLSESDF